VSIASVANSVSTMGGGGGANGHVTQDDRPIGNQRQSSSSHRVNFLQDEVVQEEESELHVGDIRVSHRGAGSVESDSYLESRGAVNEASSGWPAPRNISAGSSRGAGVGNGAFSSGVAAAKNSFSEVSPRQRSNDEEVGI